MDNRISLRIPPADLQSARQKLEEALALLKPHLEALTPGEIQELFKVGEKGSAFLEKAVGNSHTNPEFAPHHLDLAEMQTDYEGAEELVPLSNFSQQLTDMLVSTVMLSKSEAAVAALTYYNAVKQAAHDGVPGAQTIYEDLQKRFPGRPKKKVTGAA